MSAFSGLCILILRNYRDTYLKSTLLGRIFIRMYYYVSPKLVQRLNDFNYLHIFIRILLNKIISLVKV
ncbi:CFI-box-CTERM domain-containing protein [Salegentibacter tibetensis]|uniref:CFI-box-CTERM domain-containing protein n=1 Tax=Salegentibacter tibetensis TaxID=2873600 RepID=UPI003741F002